ncbi:MAG: hypothetical protein K0S79_122 [Nitrospira sp.]|jgi:hypothetical protein|nr:hypothetical protein [Nitrospira sp.]
MTTILVFMGVGAAVAILIALVLLGYEEAERTGNYVQAVIDDHNEGR